MNSTKKKLHFKKPNQPSQTQSKDKHIEETKPKKEEIKEQPKHQITKQKKINKPTPTITLKPIQTEIKEEKEEKKTITELEQQLLLQQQKLYQLQSDTKEYQQKRKEFNDKLSKQTDINDIFKTNCSWLENVEHM